MVTLADYSFPSPSGALMFLTAIIASSNPVILSFPSPSGALMFLTLYITKLNEDYKGKVSVPFRGFDVSNDINVEFSIAKGDEFPSPSGALMFLTKLVETIMASEWVSVPFRGFDVSNG